MNKWKGIIAVVSVLGTIGGVGFLVTQTNVIGTAAGGPEPTNDTGTNTGSVTMIDSKGSGVDFSVTLSTAVSSADMYVMEKQPETVSPVHFGDYLDFDAAEATSGLTQGEDYEKVSLSSASKATFTALADSGSLGPGEKTLVLVDKSNPRDYHYYFGTVTVPSEIPLWKAENGKAVDITSETSFDRFPSYDTDNAEAVDSNRDVVSLSADLDNPDSNVTDRQRTVVRSIDYTSGTDYLDEIVVNNFNDGDGISEVTCRVMVNGTEKYERTLYDGSTDEFGSDNAYSKKLVSNPEQSPLEAGSEVVVECDFTYDYNTASSSDANADIGDGEKLADFKVTDIYGNDVGTAGATSVTG